VYELETDHEAVGTVDGPPASASVAYAEVVDGSMRALLFGACGEGLHDQRSEAGPLTGTGL
jgi:hypothetical protein